MSGTGEVGGTALRAQLRAERVARRRGGAAAAAPMEVEAEATANDGLAAAGQAPDDPMPAAAANDGLAVDEGSAASATLAHLVLFAPDVGSMVHRCLTIEALWALLLTCRAAKTAIAFPTLAEALLAADGAVEMVLSAVRRGDVRLLEWAIGSPQMPRWPWPEEVGGGLMHAAAAKGRLDVMKWLRAQHPPYDVDEDERCEMTIDHVGGRGDVKMAEWLDSQGLDVTLCLPGAVRGGHLPLVRWLLKEKPVPVDEYVDAGWWEGFGYEGDRYECMFAEAAEMGHLHVLQWLRAQEPPYPWNEDACYAAARDGHMGVLRWLREQDPPCPWDEEECTKAATKWAASQKSYVRDTLRELTANKQKLTVRVRRPPGVSVGQRLRVKHNGKTYTIRVPDGVAVGGTFRIAVPAAATAR